MPFRTNINTQVTMDGKPYTILLIDNPTIDDVMVVEMKLKAAEYLTNTPQPDRKVEKDVRDALIRLGVDR
jgi:hypothetical protein